MIRLRDCVTAGDRGRKSWPRYPPRPGPGAARGIVILRFWVSGNSPLPVTVFDCIWLRLVTAGEERRELNG